MSFLKKRIYFFRHPKLKSVNESLGSICCVCFSRDNLLKLTKYKWNGVTLLEIITYCLPLQEFSNEWSPPNICSVCVGNLLHTYVFVCKASSAFLILKNDVLKTKNESDEDLKELIQAPQESHKEFETLKNERPPKNYKRLQNSGKEFKIFKEEKCKNSLYKECEPPKNSDQECRKNSDKEYVNKNPENKGFKGERSNKKPYDYKQATLQILNNETKVFGDEESRELHEIKDELQEFDEEKDPLKFNGEEEFMEVEFKSQIFQEEFVKEPQIFIIKNASQESDDSESKQPSKNHVKKEYTCEICHLTFERYKIYKRHLKCKHPENARCMCEVCGKFCVSNLGLMIHKRTHDKSVKFICRICGMNMGTASRLRVHLNEVHLREPEQRTFWCKTCGKGFKKKSGLKLHTFTHTREKPHTCDTCGASFSVKCNLLRHKMIHEGIKPFSCDKCGKRFIQKTNLNLHLNNYHTNFTKKRCRYCLLEFDDPRKLAKHVEENHNIENVSTRLKLMEQDRTCSICGKKFQCRSLLAQHLTIHTGVKNFECHVCKKRFRLGLHLKQHLLVHTEERPYQCKECGVRFRQRSHLMYHMTTHDGVKKFVCPFCNKAFALKGNLTVHVRIHTGETPYICNICDKRFNDSSSLKRHMKSKHSAEVNVKVEAV